MMGHKFLLFADASAGVVSMCVCIVFVGVEYIYIQAAVRVWLRRYCVFGAAAP